MNSVRIFGYFSFILLMITPGYPAVSEGINFSGGVWFSCEFAHSRIPPNDQCRMLDDDGFQVIEGTVFHIKVVNSLEKNCRQNRVGNCFLKAQKGLMAERSKIGPIILLNNIAEVTWLGCSQKYLLTEHAHYTEIMPDKEQCWWTPDKRYFVARYDELINLTLEE